MLYCGKHLIWKKYCGEFGPQYEWGGEFGPGYKWGREFGPRYNNNNKSIYIAPNQSRLLSGALQNMAN